MWDKWVIDASMGYPLCYCPVEGDFPDGEYSVVVGMNVIGFRPEGEVVALIHEGGQVAADAFYDEHKEEIDAALAPASTHRDEDWKVESLHRHRGGQHVGTYSGIRVTHLPSGLVAECGTDRSQHRNRLIAMDMILGGLASPLFR